MRLEGLDPGAQRVTMGIQARQWSDADLLVDEEMHIDISFYFRAELVDMILDAGFETVEVEGYYTCRPASAEETSIVLIGRT